MDLNPIAKCLHQNNIIGFVIWDGSSLVQAFVSNEANFIRQELCKIVADIIYQWMSEGLRKTLHLSKFSSPVFAETGPHDQQQIPSTRNEYESILRDRRLRVIFFKAFSSLKKDPILIFRSLWASFIIFFVGSAMASHRLLVSLSGYYLSRLGYKSKQIAMTA